MEMHRSFAALRMTGVEQKPKPRAKSQGPRPKSRFLVPSLEAKAHTCCIVVSDILI
jgi:hypothetical protein